MIHWDSKDNQDDERLVDGLVADHVGRRLKWAVVASIIVNMILWRAASGIAQKSKYKEPPPVEITRVTIDEKNRVVEKKITPQQIKKRIVKIHEEIKRKQPQRIAQKPPEGAHHRVLTAIDKHGPPPADDHTALSGGNAKVGEAIEKQQPGEAVANPPAPKKEEAPPAPAPKKEEAPPPAPKKEEAPPPPAPKKEEAPPPPAPKKEEPPKPKGPTKDAEPNNQVKPEIPDNLKQGSYKSFVRVKVEIDEDGSFNPILRTSSGNPEIDRRVLEALKRWKWKPALKDGVPVKSTQLFKFEFEVE